MKQRIIHFFHLNEFPKTSISTEVRAGLSTFLTMSYILLVNPQILSTIGIPTSDVVLGTAIGSSIGTLICGILGNLPFGLAPGMGLSAYLAYGLVSGARGMTWQLALTSCFLAGCIMGFCAITGISSFILKFIPKSVKLATVVGMGLLISLIGMKQINLVVSNQDTLVSLGNLNDYNIWLALCGVILTSTLMHYQVKGSILLGIIIISLISWSIEKNWPNELLSFPSPKLSFGDSLSFHGWNSSLFTATLGFLFVGIFDVSGVLFGMSRLAGIMDDKHHIPGDIWAYIGSSLGTIIASMMGCSPIIIHVESAAGIKEGGRTGLTSLTISFLFLISIFFAPLLESVPSVATSPVLIIVGAMMIGESVNIEWKEMDQAIPAFLTIIMMPFTFSIADGVVFGLCSAFLLSVTTGKLWRACHRYYNEQRLNESTSLLPKRENSFMDQMSDTCPVQRTPSLILLKEDLEIMSPNQT